MEILLQEYLRVASSARYYTEYILSPFLSRQHILSHADVTDFLLSIHILILKSYKYFMDWIFSFSFVEDIREVPQLVTVLSTAEIPSNPDNIILAIWIHCHTML